MLSLCGGTNNLTVGSSSLSFGAGASSSAGRRDRERELDGHRRPELAQHHADERHQQRQLRGERHGQHRHVEPQRHGERRPAAASRARSPCRRRAQATTSSVYQTESGTVGGGTVLESSNGGFNGTGYVNASATGGFSQNSNVDGRGGGSKTLRIRYALGVTTARTGRLVVNGTATNITFNGTGAWTTWATAERHRDAQQQYDEHDPLRVDRSGPGEHRPDRSPLSGRRPRPDPDGAAIHSMIGTFIREASQSQNAKNGNAATATTLIQNALKVPLLPGH